MINTNTFSYTDDNGRSFKPLVGNASDIWNAGVLYGPSPYMDKISKKVEGFCFPETRSYPISQYVPGVCVSLDGTLKYAPNVSASTWVNPWTYLVERNLTFTWVVWRSKVVPSGWRDWGQYGEQTRGSVIGGVNFSFCNHAEQTSLSSPIFRHRRNPCLSVHSGAKRSRWELERLGNLLGLRHAGSLCRPPRKTQVPDRRGVHDAPSGI